MKDRPKLSVRPALGLSIEEKLRASVNPAVKKHWDKKIQGGIVPTETKLKGPIDWGFHETEIQRLAQFEATQAARVMEEITQHEGDSSEMEVHYFGIGLGHGLRRVTAIANLQGLNLTAYDVSTTACDTAREVFEDLQRLHWTGRTNEVFEADIEFACDEEFMSPNKARLIVAPRVLDILDKQDNEQPRKMQRTCLRMGKLLSFLKILLIHPDVNGNEQAVWGDTTPHSLLEVAHFLQTGLGAEIAIRPLGTIDFHRHIYTAAVVEKLLL